MHAAMFSLKRAHHSVLRIGRPMLLDMGLTAARFDLLFALKQKVGDACGSGNSSGPLASVAPQ